MVATVAVNHLVYYHSVPSSKNTQKRSCLILLSGTLRQRPKGHKICGKWPDFTQKFNSQVCPLWKFQRSPDYLSAYQMIFRFSQKPFPSLAHLFRDFLYMCLLLDNLLGKYNLRRMAVKLLQIWKEMANQRKFKIGPTILKW